jgi:prolipoprotein diacylglyceryltransferase
MVDPVSGATSASADTPQSAASKLFDIRLLIGGLFTLYGLMLTISGFFTSDSNRQKASGININLWLGIGMLVLGLLFLLWRYMNPQRVEPTTDQTNRTEPQ